MSFVCEDFVMNSHQFRPNRLKDQAAGAEIAFVVPSVEEKFNQAVSAGAVEVGKPTQKPWGQVVSYVRDNNGFLIEICSPIHG
jgi:uncharacterized glyoxalase superfamily protein PhnB